MDEIYVNVGDAAGYVYRLLTEVDSFTTTTKIKRELKKNGFDSETVLMAIGWLAREDKISIQKNKTNSIIKLK